MRIVSLVPSITETLLAWGVMPVAGTRFCEQPGLLTVGGTKDPDVEAIVTLAPDLVVVDREENRREDADALRAHGVPLHVTAVRSVADVEPTLAELAEAVGAPAITGAAGGADGWAGVRERPPAIAVSAFVPIWRRPWMTLNADTYGASVLAHLGIATVFAAHRDRYPTVTLDEVAERRPALAVVPTEPYPFAERHLAELAPAVAPKAVLVDGRDLFWWGVRTPAALERLRALLEPLIAA